MSPNLFKGCSRIETFKIPKNCKVIDSQCLSGTMISNVDLPDSVEVLGIQCFKDCTNLVSINIKATSHLRQIDYGVFEGCLSFSQINEFTSQNFVCESGALYSSDRHKMHIYPPASKRKFFYLLEGVISVEDCAFMGCVNLESVLLPESSVTHIGRSSFEGCIHLKQITIPSSIQSLSLIHI